MDHRRIILAGHIDSHITVCAGISTAVGCSVAVIQLEADCALTFKRKKRVSIIVCDILNHLGNNIPGRKFTVKTDRQGAACKGGISDGMAIMIKLLIGLIVNDIA